MRLTPTARWWLRALRVAFVMAVAIHYFEFQGWFAGAEGRAADWYLRTAAKPGDLKILTVSIDNVDYRNYFNSTSPLDSAALMQVVAALQMKSPKVIGVDIITDSMDYVDSDYRRKKELDHATAAINATAVIKGAMPVVWAAAANVEHVEPNFPGWLGLPSWLLGKHEELLLMPGSVLGESSPSSSLRWGVPIFPSDRDRAVRRLPRTWTSADHISRRTFAGEVAFCALSRCPVDEPLTDGAHEETFVLYGQTVPNYTVGELFDCLPEEPRSERPLCKELIWRKGNRAESQIPGAVVILGGAFDASRDFFALPTGERIPGLLLNAQAVRAEIEGLKIREFPRWLTLLLDMGVGVLVAILFSERPRRWLGKALGRLPSIPKRWQHAIGGVRWRVAATLGLGAAAFLISRFVLFPWLDFLWLSWVGMLMTGLAYHIVFETREMRMKEEHAQN